MNEEVREAVLGMVHLPGGLTPENLLKEARKKRHVLHGEFEWDNDICGERYRRDQALKLIAAVKDLEYQKKARGQEPIRFRVPVRTVIQPTPGTPFELREIVLSDPVKRTQWIDRRHIELRQWCDRCPDDKELAPIRSLILKFLAKQGVDVEVVA